MVNVRMREGVDRLWRRIQIMRADGTFIQLWCPACVKEILVDYPNHRIFDAAASGGHRICSLPLPERAGLVTGHLYYLIPLFLAHHELINYHNNSDGGHFAEASSRLQPPSFAGTATDSTKQQEADDAIDQINVVRGAIRIGSASYSTDGSTVRVKLRLRKEDLASFLAANNVNIVMGNQGATGNSPWKPRLDAVAEIHGSLGNL